MADIKSELNFGLDTFGKQAMMNNADTIAQMLINLFLMRPGQLPSLPHIGINIRQYMYSLENEIDVSLIKNQISTQCPDLMQYLDLQSMQLIMVPYKTDTILYVFIPILTEDNTAISMGFKRSNTSNEITFNYKINNNLDT